MYYIIHFIFYTDVIIDSVTRPNYFFYIYLLALPSRQQVVGSLVSTKSHTPMRCPVDYNIYKQTNKQTNKLYPKYSYLSIPALPLYSAPPPPP